MIFRDIFLFGLKYVCIWRQRLRQVRVLFREIQTRQYWYSVLHSESCVGYPSLCFLTLLASLKRCNCILCKIKAQGLFLIPGSWIKGLWGVKENQTLLWVLVMYQPMCVCYCMCPWSVLWQIHVSGFCIRIWRSRPSVDEWCVMHPPGTDVNIEY